MCATPKPKIFISYAHEILGEQDQAIEKAKAAFVIFRALEDPNTQLPEGWLRKRGIDPDRL